MFIARDCYLMFIDTNKYLLSSYYVSRSCEPLYINDSIEFLLPLSKVLNVNLN